jgi:hypothetical protein
MKIPAPNRPHETNGVHPADSIIVPSYLLHRVIRLSALILGRKNNPAQVDNRKFSGSISVRVINGWDRYFYSDILSAFGVSLIVVVGLHFCVPAIQQVLEFLPKLTVYFGAGQHVILLVAAPMPAWAACWG